MQWEKTLNCHIIVKNATFAFRCVSFHAISRQCPQCSPLFCGLFWQLQQERREYCRPGLIRLPIWIHINLQGRYGPGKCPKLWIPSSILCRGKTILCRARIFAIQVCKPDFLFLVYIEYVANILAAFPISTQWVLLNLQRSHKTDWRITPLTANGLEKLSQNFCYPIKNFIPAPKDKLGFILYFIGGGTHIYANI